MLTESIRADQVCAVIVAGGRALRMGGVDKGLQAFDGQSLVAVALDRLRHQWPAGPGLIAINANRNHDTYAQYQVPVWRDTLPDFAGPLAGMLTALTHCAARFPYLLTVPCDSPLFPLDLLARLATALQTPGTDIAMASAPERTSDGSTTLRRQPVFCLLRSRLAPDLAAYLARGERKIDTWCGRHPLAVVAFNAPGDAPHAFANANTLQELMALQHPKITMQSLNDIAATLQGYDAQALHADTATAFLQRLVQPQPASQRVALKDALGHVLAAEVRSPINVPAHDNSAMDGYAFDGALLASASQLTLHVVGTAMAGAAWRGTLTAGCCVRIMTGAVMPEGLDTVVPQELVTVEGDHITLETRLLQPGDNRRLCGEDLRCAQRALAAGTRIGPAALGLLASLGLAEVTVHRPLRVAFFSTGNEILGLGEMPREGCVYDSNRYTLFGLLTRLGVQPIDLGLIPDDPQALETAFTLAASQADAIITSGGVSVGEADHTKAVMRKLAGGADGMAFWKIAMRPGRPMAVGRMGNTVLFGLPGNPVAVMVTFLAFVRPALLRMMGCTTAAPPLLQAHSTETLRKKAGRTEYQRAIVQRTPAGVLEVRTTGQQGSGVLRSMVEANGLIVLHHAQETVKAGELVDVMVFDGVI